MRNGYGLIDEGCIKLIKVFTIFFRSAGRSYLILSVLFMLVNIEHLWQLFLVCFFISDFVVIVFPECCTCRYQ